MLSCWNQDAGKPRPMARPSPERDETGTSSPEKLAVLEQRAKLKQALFHPADARYEGDSRPAAFLKDKALPLGV